MARILKIYYRKNLDMSPGKLAAQAVHAAGVREAVVVLGLSDIKFEEMKERAEYVVIDAGFTEVKPGTETCLAFWEEE